MLTYRLEVYGNWCQGWHYQIVNEKSGHVLRDCGPNHNPDGRKECEDDARSWAADHGITLKEGRP